VPLLLMLKDHFLLSAIRCPILMEHKGFTPSEPSTLPPLFAVLAESDNKYYGKNGEKVAERGKNFVGFPPVERPLSRPLDSGKSENFHTVPGGLSAWGTVRRWGGLVAVAAKARRPG
jgi:hypothetical protein